MNYSQALAWLYHTQLHGIKLGLENIRRLLDGLGVSLTGGPQILHVAGTNGKGSVCAMIDAILRAGGARTGLFTSPHLVTFRERIRVNGEMISEDDVRDGLTRIRALVSDWEIAPTFFEITTALALGHFQKQRAEIAVLETGMGGRLDATNVVTPAVSVVTRIDFDHAQWLGDTLEKIATEKAGIIKPNVPVVSAPQPDEVARVLEKVATEKNAELRFVREPLPDFELALAGSHQKWNAALAVEALRAAGLDVGGDAIRRGLRGVEWPGRFQIIQHSKFKIQNCVVLDGAHNESAARQLAQTWREVFGQTKATLILSVVRDKDLAAVCRALVPLAGKVIVTTVRNLRSSTTAELCAVVTKSAPELPCVKAENLALALELAAKEAMPILVAGSLFLIGEAVALLQQREVELETGVQ